MLGVRTWSWRPAHSKRAASRGGPVWTVRPDPYGHPSAGSVRLSCSRPASADQRFPGAAAGRRATVEHVNMHLTRIRTGGGPRGEACCACRAADCAWHTRDTDTGPAAGRRGGARPVVEEVRCGGPVVLTVYADRAGRLWRIAEMCARYAAATTGCRVLDTAPPPARPVPDRISRSSIAAAMAPSSVLSAPPHGRQRPRRLTGGAARLGQRRFGAGPGYGPGPSLRLPRGSVPVSAPCTQRLPRPPPSSP
ncbi:hypothetical protein BJY27_008392 [Streptomyces rapamycinicus]|uniref:Uncharacterized protein n=2 Tax=Streptomyces rapamycinicus TaxID=1226757 RepID=A0A3L8QWK4_STRRN|nr:hypothetical protein [Streptomyces rapamycinicus]RLV71691.1 hypothetical protein D3C57_144230 [Streptomyces rapamycinicus NRRL 5491]